MQHKHLFASILIAVTVVAGLYCGMPTIGKPCLETNTNSKISTNQRPMTSQTTPSVVNWNKINFAKIMPDRQTAPSPGRANANGVDVPLANISSQPDFHPERNVNATPIQPVMRLGCTEKFLVNCTNANVVSNFTIRYRPSLANDTYDTVRFTQLNSTVLNYTRTYTQKNNTEIIISDFTNASLYVFRFQIYDFYFNISEAVRVFEGISLYAGSVFLIEINYSFPIQVTDWKITTTSPSFTIEGLKTSHTISYAEQFTIKSAQQLLLTCNFIPVDRASTFDYAFLSKDLNYPNSALTPFTPSLNLTVGGYNIAPLPTTYVNANKNGTLINVSFKINATVGFTEIMANRWTFDRLVASLDMRVRQYQLSVMQGPETYLVENIRFNVTDMYYRNVFPSTNASYPDGWFYFQNNTYPEYKADIEKTVDVPNGTRCYLHRIQKHQGPVTVSMEYNSSYNVTFRVVDEVRNPLSGAEVVLNYSGVRFGSLMAWNTSLAYPSVKADTTGSISFSYLPEGNYTVMVYYQGNLVQTKNFTLDSTNAPLSLEIITTVPYAPSILIGWFIIFGVLALLGILLLKRKR
jgi:hypothetical protein